MSAPIPAGGARFLRPNNVSLEGNRAAQLWAERKNLATVQGFFTGTFSKQTQS